MPPCSLLTGWYDFFLEECLCDYQRARERQQDVRMTIGNFSHWGLIAKQKLYSNMMVDFFGAFLRDSSAESSRESPLGPLTSFPVNIQVIGAYRNSSWRGFSQWPPPAKHKFWWLASDRQLVFESPLSSGKLLDEYVYDPLQPTPSLGGPSFNPMNAGAWDQAQIERRRDVVVYTSGPLAEDLEVIGQVVLRLCCSHSAESTDFLARLCDVRPGKDGKATHSVNLCEGLLRVAGSRSEDKSLELRLGHIAALFRKGHHIRLQICSGAHPRWMRNLGYGDPIATATRTCCSSNKILSGSQLILPVFAPDEASFLKPTSRL